MSHSLPTATTSIPSVPSVPSVPAIRFEGVHFAYGDRPILEGVDVTIPQGKITAILGSSGGGKTTLLRLIGGQYQAQKGHVWLYKKDASSQDVGRMSSGELYSARRGMGVLFQFGALFTDLSVFDNVAFPLREHTQLPEVLIRDIVLMKLNAVGLRGARDLMPSEISGGMARRVALARAIAMDPQLMLYDEPFAGLDPISLGTTARLIRDLNDALGMTSVLVSHDIEETLTIADQIVVLAGGHIVASGTPQEVQASQDPWVVQFIGGHMEGPVLFDYPGPAIEADFGIVSSSSTSTSTSPST
jgi:phospholipid/cholesterol/gamma-HCH transport system ATP-binding protein